MSRPGRILAWLARLAVLAALAAAVLGASSVAHADEPSAKDRREARRLFRAGEQAYHAGKYGLAADAFEAAYAILPAPQIAFSTAQAQRLQYFVDKDVKRLARAVELFRLYLEKTPEGAQRDIAVTHLSEIEPMLQRMEEAANRLTARPGDAGRAPARPAEVMLTSPVPGAQGSIAGTSGALPLKVEVEPGRYEATVTAEGYAAGTKTVDAVAGRFFVVEVPLRPIPARVSVATADGATVMIDGRAAAGTPLRAPVELAAGSYALAVRKRGHRLWSRDIEVERGQNMAVDVELRRTRQRMLSYGVFALGGVVLAGGVLINLHAASEGSEASKLEEQYQDVGFTREQLAAYEQHRDERNRAVLGAFVLYGTAVAAGAGGFLLYWLDLPDVARVRREKSGGERPQLTPTFGTDGLGVSLSGRF
ncbi:MAG TPA: PEGA domain-containing protein [Haliangium sp.]|nr:PEGA domain-containing protein [Haliangium sp.]